LAFAAAVAALLVLLLLIILLPLYLEVATMLYYLLVTALGCILLLVDPIEFVGAPCNSNMDSQ